MPRYWVIAPAESQPPALFDKVWQFDLANKLISIGWREAGDLSQMSREELSGALASAFPEKPRGTRSLVGNMLWAFYHEVLPGDFVIARRGLKTIAAVGKVTQPAVYSPGRNPAIGHPNFLGVEWQEQPRDKNFPALVFRMQTLMEITEAQYRDLAEGGIEAPVPDLPGPPEATEDPITFVLEKYLEEFIFTNFDMIFKGNLKIYHETGVSDGRQYPTEVGPIDILALDPKTNSFVVIELKRGRPSDQVVGQILRYMGWVKKNLCKDGQRVRGLVICREPDSKLSYALDMVEHINVRYYTVSFKLTETPIKSVENPG